MQDVISYKKKIQVYTWLNNQLAIFSIKCIQWVTGLGFVIAYFLKIVPEDWCARYDWSTGLIG